MAIASTPTGMRCPHCLVMIHAMAQDRLIGEDTQWGWFLRIIQCPACSRLILFLAYGHLAKDGKGQVVGLRSEEGKILVLPRASGRAPSPPEVPAEIAEDYKG